MNKKRIVSLLNAVARCSMLKNSCHPYTHSHMLSLFTVTTLSYTTTCINFAAEKERDPYLSQLCEGVRVLQETSHSCVVCCFHNWYLRKRCAVFTNHFHLLSRMVKSGVNWNSTDIPSYWGCTWVPQMQGNLAALGWSGPHLLALPQE